MDWSSIQRLQPNKRIGGIIMNVGTIAREGYMGGTAFTGVNYKGYMRYTEINKLVKKAFKEKYPDVKVSCRGQSFSGGQSCDGTLYIDLKKSIYSLEEFKAKCKEANYYGLDYRWLNDKPAELMTIEERIEAIYYNYINILKAGMRKDRCSDEDKRILKDDVIEQVTYLNDLYDSLNEEDINGMVDYFDVCFYKSVEIKAIE